MLIDGDAFDRRLDLSGEKVSLGETYEFPIKFLNRDLALPKLSPGKRVTPWEGKEIADAEIVRID